MAMPTKLGMAMHRVVAWAVNEIKAAFAGHTVEAVADGKGGAFVRVGGVLFGNQYEPNSGWVAFRIDHAYTHTDIYPNSLLSKNDFEEWFP